MTLSRYELKALEYRARAEDAVSAAKACRLERAREQHQLAAARWIALAEAEEDRALSNSVRLTAAPPSAAPPQADGPNPDTTR